MEAVGDFTPIISEELFARVQATFRTPTRAQRTTRRHVDHADFPLRRFARCGTCDGALTGSWSTGRTKTRYAFYHCQRGCRRVPKIALETAFLALLDTLRPRPGVWRLLEAAVLDVWHAEQRDASATSAAARTHRAGLERKLARVDEAFLYDRTIDEASYRAQRDELRESLALATMEIAQTTADEIDVEGMLALAQHALTHASALWTAATSIEERITVQWTFFPDGLVLAPAASVSMPGNARGQAVAFDAPASCLRIFNLDPIARSTGAAEGLVVDNRPPTWKQISGFLHQLATLRPAA